MQHGMRPARHGRGTASTVQGRRQSSVTQGTPRAYKMVACICPQVRPATLKALSHWEHKQRSMAAPTDPAPGLTIQEKLLLSQAVYKLGAIAWPAVSQLLLGHPCVRGRPDALFGPEACEKHYVELMTSIGQNMCVPMPIPQPRCAPRPCSR